MNFDSREFRNALGTFATGVTVITVEDENSEEGVGGLAANAFSSVSLAPPIVLICVDHKSTTLPYIHEKGQFAVNILSNEQINHSRYFAKQKIDGEVDISFARSKDNIPSFEGSLASLHCKVLDAAEVGDHIVF